MFRAIAKAGVTITSRGVTSAVMPPFKAQCNSTQLFAMQIARNFSKDRASKIVKPGEAIVVDGAPHKVQKITQGKRGKGGGYVRAVIKNLVTGNIYEKTFTSDEVVDGAELEKEIYQYSWNDGNNYSFLNANTYEEVQVPKEDLELADFLVSGQEVKLLKFKDKIIGAEMARTQEFEVVSVNEQKTSSGQHAATLNSGAEIFVPTFIGAGMKIRVNVYDGLYVERA